MFVHLYVEIIHSLKLVDYLHVQADNPWYNYYVVWLNKIVPFKWELQDSRISYNYDTRLLRHFPFEI